MTGRQRVADRGNPRKYWTQVPNLVDDSDLDPFGRTLLMHYLRIAGQRDICDETVRETASHCHMSTGMVMKARTELETGGWISVEEIGTHGRGSWQRIHLLDRWVENMNRYEKADETPSDEGNVHPMNNSADDQANCSPGEQNANPVNNSEVNVHPMNNLYHHVNNSNSPPFLTGEELKKRDEKTGEKRACAREVVNRDGATAVALRPNPPPNVALRRPCPDCQQLVGMITGKGHVADCWRAGIAGSDPYFDKSRAEIEAELEIERVDQEVPISTPADLVPDPEWIKREHERRLAARRTEPENPQLPSPADLVPAGGPARTGDPNP